MSMGKSYPELCDYYQAVVYDRGGLADELSRLLPGEAGATILDCACGTGLPAVDLRARGFEITCSDGDPGMLRQFRRNAKRREVSDDCVLAKWNELPNAIPHQYDYVMCRGNSLIYATSWGEIGQPPATTEQLVESLIGISAQVATGGTLHIDLPSESPLPEVTYPEAEVWGSPVRVTESVVTHNARRTWHQEIAVGSQTYRFTTNSASLSPDTLCQMLRGLGFEQIRPVVLRGERPSYQVLLARKGQ